MTLLVNTFSFLLTFLFLSFIPSVFAEDYSDIIFYHNCDALGSAVIAGGSGTVNYDASISLGTGVIGSAWQNTAPTSNYHEAIFSATDNID